MQGKRNLFTGLVIGIFVTGAIAYFFIKPYLQKQEQSRQIQITQQAEILEASKKSSYAPMLKFILDRISDEMKQHPDGILSDALIEKVAAMCYVFQPYYHPPDDSLPNKKLSPERGQLLLLLTTMKIDSAIFRRIKSKSSFEYADLRQADLSGSDLRGADLKGAELENANLQESKLNDADLSFANLWGAKLNHAQLIGANLKRAELSWADLSDADLRISTLDEANLVSAQLRKANLHGASCQWVDFSEAFLNGADASGTDLFRTVFRKAQLVQTNFSGSKMTYTVLIEANLNETNFTDADLSNAILSDPNWMSMLDTWKVLGAEDIRVKYKLTESKTFYKDSKFQLFAK